MVERPYKEVKFLLDELNKFEVIPQDNPEAGEDKAKDVEVKDVEEVKPKRKRGK